MSTYRIDIQRTAGDGIYAEGIASLDAAKAAARTAYDQLHPMAVDIIDEATGQRVMSASQPHGRGMLWTD